MPRAFARFFNGPDLWASEALWRAYLLWQMKRRNENFAAFAQDWLNSRNKARAAVNAWPNPFANAKKGESYEISFALPPCVKKYHLFGVEKPGLVWEDTSAQTGAGTGRVYGIPKEAGEYEIALSYIWDGWRSGAPLLKRELKLIVNPDPRELWRNIPSDPGMEYWRPDRESEILRSADALMTGASVRGRSHAHAGSPRDDAFALAAWNGWNLMAVADGAGSAQYSRRGAELACAASLAVCEEKLALTPSLDDLFASLPLPETGSDWLAKARRLAYGILPHAAFETHRAIRREAAEYGRETRAYATTLLLALAKKYAGGWALMAFQIGDGAMAMLAPDGPKLLCTPDEGEYGGQTCFVTMPELFEGHELMRRLHVAFVPGLQGLISLTDGVSDPRFGTRESLENSVLWLKLWRELVPLATGGDPEKALMEWLDFWERGSHDDRTLALLLTEE